MISDFTISHRHSAGNLHIKIEGDFSSICAWVLIKTIYMRYRGTGRIFIRTDGLKHIHADGADLFKKHLNPGFIHLSDVYFKGEKGLLMAPDGTRVVICRKDTGIRKKRPKKSHLRLCGLEKNRITGTYGRTLNVKSMENSGGHYGKS